MAKLILSFKGETLREYDLDRETMLIGRKADNDIHIDNLAVSGKHAKVLTILNDSFIEDLGSTNGTFIDGEKIRKHALKNGEVITIGKHKLTYVNSVYGSGDGDFEKTVVIRPDAAGMPAQDQTGTNLEKSIGKIASDLAAAGPVGKDGPGPASLSLLNGTNKGKEILLRQALTTLGKPGVQVAAITRRPSAYYLTVVDAASSPSNPTVNGKEVNNEGQGLNNGDEIEVAGIKMRFNML